MRMSVWVADLGWFLLPFPNGSIPAHELKEDHVGISRGSPGNLMQAHTHEQCGPEQEVTATEGQAGSDSPDPQKPHTMDKPGSKPGQEPGARALSNPRLLSSLALPEGHLPGSQRFSGSV